MPGGTNCVARFFWEGTFVQDISPIDNPGAVAPVPGTCAGRLPWEGLPTIFGETRVARTDLGSTVSVFVPRTEYQLRFRYFCHGWALGSFQLHGYTPYSGHPMMTVLHDEWQEVGNPTVGDIAVWYETGGKRAQGTYRHGLMDGSWTFWRLDGAIDTRGSGIYQAGEKIGMPR